MKRRDFLCCLASYGINLPSNPRNGATKGQSHYLFCASVHSIASDLYPDFPTNSKGTRKSIQSESQSARALNLVMRRVIVAFFSVENCTTVCPGRPTGQRARHPL